MLAPALAFAADTYLLQSKGAKMQGPQPPDPLKAEGLKPYPPGPPGVLNPPNLEQYGGGQGSSYATVELPNNESFESFMDRMIRQRPKVDAAQKSLLESHFDLKCKADPEHTMSRGKPLPLGPTARLREVKSFEELAQLSPEEIKKRDLFPYKPLFHPLQSTAHMVFPQMWTRVHPEHERFDVSFDLPDCFLPEFPPPLYLTNHPELGDVSRGQEITLGNYHQMFDGVLTPEQLEGLRILVTPFPTTWFNQTNHRVTVEPSAGVTCFSCHVNGHTNGAFELAPDSRPNYARLRVDTPTMRGNYSELIFSSKRSIRSMDHFAEVEEYFDGDITILNAIGGRDLQKPTTNRVGDFNAIIDFPPAPKLDVLGRLIPARSTPAELRGEALFHGKAQCAACHSGTYFNDNQMHDLKVERFYQGRAEGPIKTFPLRGIKDSPPYLHDGRLLTLEDTVEFFDLVLGTKLNADEKADLAAYLKAL